MNILTFGRKLPVLLARLHCIQCDCNQSQFIQYKMYSIWSEIPIHVIRNSKLTHDQSKGSGSSFNVGIWVPAIEHASKT